MHEIFKCHCSSYDFFLTKLFLNVLCDSPYNHYLFLKKKRLKFIIVANGKMKIANILEMINHRERWSEIWDSGVLIQHLRGIFDLLVFKLILGHLVHLS